MSTEHTSELETNALGQRLGRGVEQFKQGKLISYRLMAVILLVVTATGLFLYIRSGWARERSQTWADLEGANSVAALEEFAGKHPDSPAARVARVHVARQLLGPDGIDKLITSKPEDRTKAVENVEKARELFTKLADEFKADPVFQAECYLGMAKAEAALVGIAKDGSPTDFRGSTDKVVEDLDKLAAVAAGTPWGDEAKKTAESLRTNARVKEEFREIQVNLYNMQKMPAAPGSAPVAPGGAFPGGGLSGFPPLGGLPGGNTLQPSAPTPPAPPVTPPSAPVTPPTPPAGVTPTPAPPPSAPPTPTAPTRK